MGTLRRPYLIAVLAGVVLLAAASALPNVRFGDSANRGDTPLYRQYGENVLHGKLPYRDFFDEYPPGALPMFVLPAALPGPSFTFWSKSLQWLLASCALALTALALRGGASPVRASLIGLTPALLGQVTFTRFDFWPAALTAAAVAALVHARFRIALALLALGVAAKEYPLVLLPPFLLYVDRVAGRRETGRSTAVFALVLCAIVLPFAALGPGGVAYSLDVQFRRPLQVETLGGSILLVLHRLGAYAPHVVSTYGSQNLSGGAAAALAVLTTVVEAAALLGIWIVFARGTRGLESLLACCGASVLAFVVFGKVLSPQYMIWLVPFVPLLRGRAWRGGAVLLAGALGLTQVWSQSRYHEVVAGGAIVWAVLARDLVLVVLFALAARAVYVRGGNQTSKPSVRTSV